MSNTNYQHFTYKWQPQPYVPSKNNKKSIIPSNARPNTNGVWLINQPGGTFYKDGNAFLPRPIKHWRKQLQPDIIRSGTRTKNVIASELPGAVITLGSGLEKNEIPSCCGPQTECVSSGNDNLQATLGLWVIGGQNNSGQPSIIYSSDGGINWNQSNSVTGIFSTSVRAVAFNGTMWVAGGDGQTLAYSYDAITWTVCSTLPSITDIYSIAWSPQLSRWVAIGVPTGTSGIAYSNDGINWIDVAGNYFITGVTIRWNNINQFVAVGSGGPSNIYYSNNGITWNSGISSIASPTGLGWDGSQWVATRGSRAIFSNNGLNWSPEPPIVNSNQFIFSLYYANGIWVGSGIGTVYYSNNALNWTASTGTTFFGPFESYYSNGKWITCGQIFNPGEDPIAYSTDGINWTPVSISPTILSSGISVYYGETNSPSPPQQKCYKTVSSTIVSNLSADKYNSFCEDPGNCNVIITKDDVINKCWNGPVGKRICCNPEDNIIKGSQTTPINDNFTNTSAYLQSRCKKYEQRLSSQHALGVKYYTSTPTFFSDLSGVALYPNDEPDGPQVTQKVSCSGNCGDICANCNRDCPTGYVTQLNQDTIYKPSNRPFAVEGGVSGGLRILKLKNDSFYKNGAQTNNANGLKATNYGYYNWEGNGSYFVKIKPTAPQCYVAGPGDHTRCFFTPTGSIAKGRSKLRGYR